MFDTDELTDDARTKKSLILSSPLQDLAAFQIRNTTEAIRRGHAHISYYREMTHGPIDADVFNFHTEMITAVTPLRDELAHVRPRSDEQRRGCLK